jgi:hypothetical protein
MPRKVRAPRIATVSQVGEKHEHPNQCIKCGSLQLNPVPGAKTITRPIAGTLINGFDYSAIQWTRKRCECGQVLTVRTYLP